MSRLEDLRKQRGLVAEHLAWLDSEISLERALHPPSPSAPLLEAKPPTLPPAPVSLQAAAPAEIEAERILANYAQEEAADPDKARKGCLMVFGLILLLGTILVLTVYFIGYHREHPFEMGPPVEKTPAR
jgi:hypothetical protein